MIGNKEKIQIALPFIAILISLLVMKGINFKLFEPPLLPTEKKVLDFTPVKIAIKGEKNSKIHDDIISPFEITKKDFPSVPLSALTSHETRMDAQLPELKLTMIIMAQKSGNMAIVNGLVLKEGDIFSNMKVQRIEKNRILLKNVLDANKTRWLYLEEK